MQDALWNIMQRWSISMMFGKLLLTACFALPGFLLLDLEPFRKGTWRNCSVQTAECQINVGEDGMRGVQNPCGQILISRSIGTVFICVDIFEYPLYKISLYLIGDYHYNISQLCESLSYNQCTVYWNDILGFEDCSKNPVQRVLYLNQYPPSWTRILWISHSWAYDGIWTYENPNELTTMSFCRKTNHVTWPWMMAHSICFFFLWHLVTFRFKALNHQLQIRSSQKCSQKWSFMTSAAANTTCRTATEYQTVLSKCVCVCLVSKLCVSAVFPSLFQI